MIAGRLPGRTDNEIKNYWNTHLSKKINQREKQSGGSREDGESKAGKRTTHHKVAEEMIREENTRNYSTISNGGDINEDSSISFNVDDFFDFSNEDPLNLEWMSHFLEIDKGLTF